MSKAEIIEKTVAALHKLPENRGEEVADFADFMLQKSEEDQLQAGIQQAIAQSESFAFLADDEELYNLSDLKEVF